MRTPLLRSLGLALTFTLAASGVASAHDCFNISRSDQGNASVFEHSPNWISIGTLTELYSTPPDPSVPALTPSQVEWAVAAAKAAGAPDSITVFVRHTISEGTPAEARNGGDGRGIDYLEAWFPILIEIYLRALEQ
jgi:hypothetical protein